MGMELRLFYPRSQPGEYLNGTAATFEQACADLEPTWRMFSSKRTEADYQVWRDDRDWHARKYAMWERGEVLPSQKRSSRVCCVCGERVDSPASNHIHSPHIYAAQAA